MKWIKESFIKKKLREKNLSKKAQLSLVNVKHIGVIASSLVELHEVIAIIAKTLGNDIKISGFFYAEGSAAKEAFSHKSFSFSATPRDSIAEFIRNRADLIITCSEKLNIFSLYLLYLNPQSYIIGFYDESHMPHLDLMLAKEDMDLKENVENLLKYLKQVI